MNRRTFIASVAGILMPAGLLEEPSTHRVYSFAKPERVQIPGLPRLRLTGWSLLEREDAEQIWRLAVTRLLASGRSAHQIDPIAMAEIASADQRRQSATAAFTNPSRASQVLIV